MFAQAATVARSAAVSIATKRSSCAAAPWSSQSSTASTRWSNSVCAAHSFISGATNGATTSRAAPTATSRRCSAYSANCGSRAAWRHSSRKPSGHSRATASSARVVPVGAELDVREEELDLAVEDLLEHGAVEVLLGLEVPVDDELGDAGGSGDLLHRGGRIPAVPERRRGRLRAGLPGGRDRAGARRASDGCHPVTLAFTLGPSRPAAQQSGEPCGSSGPTERRTK